MKTAFDTQRSNAYTFDPEQLVLVTDKNDPLYDPRVENPPDENLVRSMMMLGWFGTIEIAKIGGQPVVVDGRRRTAAAKEANRRLKEQGSEGLRVTAVLKRGDETALFGITIAANECRLDDTPLGRAQKCAKYLSFGRSEDEAAIVFGVTKHCVQAWMRLLECCPKVRKAVEDGKISASAAAKLADLPADEQVSALDKAIEESGKNGKKVTARTVAKATGKTSGKTKSRKEIMAKLEETGLSAGFKAALRWVLGEED